jgi:hypothetical protein
MIMAHDLLVNPKTVDIFAGLPRTARIVDVGCGIRPCPVFACREHVCIEPHGEYVEHLMAWHPAGRRVIIVQGEADRLAEQPRKDATVLLLDVIEHLEKDKGREIVRLAEEFEHAVLFTPLGWCEQGEENPDNWDLNGGFWQKHRSAWQPDDFPEWRVRTWQCWDPAKDVGAILALR